MPMNDATDDPDLLVKKRPNVVLWLCCCLGAFFLLFLFLLFGPDPPIVISKQTTHVITPLRRNGLPDYLEWLRQERRKGVTSENNAAVLLWHFLRFMPWVGSRPKP